MGPHDEKTIGDARAEIATRIVRLHSEYYGKGPTRAKAVRHRGHRRQQIRRRFQQAMADEFKGIVEQATGRVVRAFLSETNLEADVAVEFFLLGERRTDMRGFEPER